MSKLRALGDRIVIKVIKKEGSSKNNIIIPDKYRENEPQLGEVTSVGNSAETNISIEDTVMFDKYSGITYCEDELMIIGLEDIVAIIER